MSLRNVAMRLRLFLMDAPAQRDRQVIWQEILCEASVNSDVWRYWPLSAVLSDVAKTKNSSRFSKTKKTATKVVAFSSLARILGRMFDHSFPPPQRFFLFKVEISARTLAPLFSSGSVHSGPASYDDCGWVFPDELRVSLFPDRFPHYAWTAA